MGRSKNYNIETLLDQMVNVFWQKGYNATSLSDLEEATGVNRRSLLHEFESKENLFLESLQHYIKIKAIPEGQILGKAPLSPQNIKDFFRGIHFSGKTRWGCLFLLTIVEQESAPPASIQVIKKMYRGLEDAFFANLQPLVESKSLSKEKALSLATFFVNALHGIIVNARAQSTNKELNRIVDVTLSVLPD